MLFSLLENAKTLMKVAERLEIDVDEAHKMARKALNDSKQARKVGEEVTQNITVLIKVI